ncbi:MAG: VOC family protein [Planctomycetota bacterium]
MSYVALLTERYEEVCAFYGHVLGCSVLDSWDRPNARASVFDLQGLSLEILDATRGLRLELGNPRERVHLVIEVEDVETFRGGLGIPTEQPHEASWGARLFRLKDPDGIPITVLQRLRADASPEA